MSESFYKIKKGLDIPIKGSVLQGVISEEKRSKYVALKGRDFVAMKPEMLVQVGDKVKVGDPLFKHKKIKDLFYTSPAGGKIFAIHRAEKREFISVVIEIDDKEAEKFFKSYTIDELKKLSKDEMIGNLLESGQWAYFRRRPYETVANPTEKPKSIFINATSSDPYSMDKSVLYKGNEKNMNAGIEVLSKLTDGDIHFCIETNKKPSIMENEKVKYHVFEGKHPYGNVGTHIHLIDPVGQESFVWHLDIVGLIAIGEFFLTGKIKLDRIISLGGTVVREGRLLKTRIGVDTRDIVSGELTQDQDVRIISGSVLSGKNATIEGYSYLGFYDNQVSVIKEETKRHFLAMHDPGFHLFSVKNIFLSKLFSNKRFDITTTEHCGERAIFPMNSYQKVMPLDIEVLFLLKALASSDIEGSIELGALELAEEDLALSSFVCPGKNEHGTSLRRLLDTLEKES